MEIKKLGESVQLSEQQEAEMATQKLDKNIEGAMSRADQTETRIQLEGKTEAELWELIRGQFETTDTRGSLDSLKMDIEADLAR